MHNSKLIRMLKTLDKQEFKKLDKFVKSAYFIKERHCHPLYNILKKHYPGFNAENISKEKIYEELYPGKKYGDGRSVSLLLTLSSELYRMCKLFLVQLELEAETSVSEHLLLEQLRRRKLNKEFERGFSAAAARRLKNKTGAIDHYNNYKLHFIKGEYEKSSGNIKGVLDGYTVSGESALVFGIITAYKYSEIREICENAYNIKPPHSIVVDFFDSLNSTMLVNKMKENNDPYYPAVYANYLVYNINKEPQETKYLNALRTLLAENLDDYGRTEQFILYSVVVSALIRLENADHNIERTNELFEVYNTMFRKGIYKYKDNENLEAAAFRAILSVAFELRKLDWAEEFITRTSAELPEKLKESMTNHAYANLHFLRKEHNKALGYINRVNYDYPLHKIDSKTLTFRIYYELGDYEHAFSVLDTTRQYVVNTKDLAKIFRERQLNFLKYASELIRRKTTGNKRDIELTLKKLTAEKAVELSGWLKRKFEELRETY